MLLPHKPNHNRITRHCFQNGTQLNCSNAAVTHKRTAHTVSSRSHVK